MTETRFFATRSLVNPDNDFHAAMGRVDFSPRSTFEQQRVRLINYIAQDDALSEYSSDETRTRALELVRQLTQLEEPEAHGEHVLAEAGGVRYAIHRRG